MKDSSSRLNAEPMLTFVVPTYGVEEWLASCIESVLKQSQSVEVIVVIDASPDRSLSIAESMARRDARVRVVQNPRNLGLGASRNVGLRLARGKYVAFIDSDDVVVPEAHSQMVCRLDETGSDFVTSMADEFGRKSGRSRYWTTRSDIFEQGALRTTITDHPELIVDHTAWTKVFRKSFLDQIGFYWPENTKCEDVAASTRAYLEADAIDVFPSVTYLYRRREGSITTSLNSSNRTLVDWARQTGDSIKQIQRSDDENVLQAFLAKLLTMEIPSRLSACLELGSGFDYELLRDVIASAARLATEATLSLASVGTLQGLAQLDRNRDFGETFWTVASSCGCAHARRDEAEIGQRLLETERSIDQSYPLLSVIIPTHDVGLYLSETLHSLTRQDYPNVEFVIVDDGSKDDTVAIARKFQEMDSRVLLWNSPGVGGAQARNFGVERATGDYITFCDGDDIVPNGAYSSLMRSALESGAEVVIGGFQKFWSNSTWSDSRWFGHAHSAEAITIQGRPELIRNRTCWNRVFQKSFWSSFDIHFPTTARANDILPMTTAMLAAESISVVPDIVYSYRARPGAGSMTAELGTIESLVGYFRQEVLCSAIVGSGPEKPIVREYWKTALGADGWGNLGRFLASGPNLLSKRQSGRAASSIDALLRRAPAFAFVAVGARKAVCYALAAAGRFSEAYFVWRLEEGTWHAETLREASTLVGVLHVALSAGADRSSVLRVFRGDVVRPMIDDRSKWNEGAAELLLAECRGLNTMIDLHGAPAPETKEVRVVSALLEGTESDLWRELRSTRSGAAIRARAHQEQRGSLILSFDPREVGDSPTWVACVPKGAAANGQRRCVFEGPEATDGSECLLLLNALPPGEWTVQLLDHDKFGSRTRRVQLEWTGSIRRSARYRPSVGTSHGGLLVLEKGVSRVQRALLWRLRKGKRRLRS